MKKEKLKYKEIEGNLITLAKQGKFDVIAHGCNCFNAMYSGIAVQMAEHFDCHIAPLENPNYSGHIIKLGIIDIIKKKTPKGKTIDVINAYTQFLPGANLDYNALIICLKKINNIYNGHKIGLPQIGCGIAGGKWETVRYLIQRYLKDCYVTVVIYKPLKTK